MNKYMIRLKIKEAKSSIQKILGLICKTSPEILLIKTRFGIHTFGMRFPIDIVVLNRNYQVVALKENLKPFNFFFWNPLYNIILELPNGAIQKNKIKKGIQLRLSYFD